MAVYVVGDIQGCYKPLRALLKQVEFNPESDVLWCCGDLVNRGPDSLKVLRYLKSLGDACITVLGNHDLQLLAYAAGGKSFAGDTLDEVLAAEDAGELIEWLRFRPLIHHDKELNWCMVHAGLSPVWSLEKAKDKAAEIEAVLRSPLWGNFCKQLQLKGFESSEPEGEIERRRFATAVFTRTRFCNSDGVFDWKHKTSEVNADKFQAWYSHPKARWKEDCRLVYGHWAAKGLVVDRSDVLGLDSGCVWGGSLTLAEIDKKHEVRLYQQPCEACQPIK